MSRVIVYLLLMLLFTTCTKKQVDERYIQEEKIGKIKSVLILGNSIVQHDPRPEVGWKGNWGMAASASDSDFVHVLSRYILQKDSTVKIQYKNIAAFEVNFKNFDLRKLDSFRAKMPDLILLRIAENVNPANVYDSNFVDYYDKLLNYVDAKGDAVKVVTDGFWPSSDLTNIITDYSRYKKCQFIHLTKLYYTDGNTAEGLFANADVSKHPGNKGMREIANTIWNYISVYFP